MCGMFGYSTNKNIKLTAGQKKIRGNILAGLAVAMQERGVHSTGVAGVKESRKKLTWGILKEAISASEFVNTDDFASFVKEEPRTVIGHTRFATVGTINAENAHPFQIENIIGCHNGHVSNWKDIYPAGQVDSEAIFASLAEYKDIGMALKRLQGGFAITWLDQYNLDDLYMVVDINPLFVTKIHELQTYFWASTKFSLLAVLASHFNLKKDDVWSPQRDTVYKIDGQHQIEKIKIDFGDYTSSYVRKGMQASTATNDDDEEESEMVEYDQKTQETTSHWEKIMDLSPYEMEAIMMQAEEGLCGLCDQQIDMDNEIIWWYGKEDVILCQACTQQIKDWSNFIFLDKTNLIDIEAELYEIELAEKGESGLKNEIVTMTSEGKIVSRGKDREEDNDTYDYD